MKKIGFIGAYDKTDLLIYTGKVLAESNKKVLIVDGTILQKTRYTVPCIAPSKCYITTYENMDIAIGFENFQDIINYSGVTELEYDFALIDIDNKESFEKFETVSFDANFFVTAFDNYSLKKGLEIIGNRDEKLLITKILFSRHMENDEDEYLNFLSFYYSVEWKKDKIYFPLEVGDNSVIIENQRNARISYKELSEEYKDGLLQTVLQVAPEIKLGNVLKIFKNI